jgi:primosomal protein N' (replication factor Y)
VNAVRGSVVSAPIGNRETLAVVWGKAEGTVGDNRLKVAEPLEGEPRLPPGLCDFIDWVADYTLNPPGAILAMALRSRGAFEPEALRTAYIKGETVPAKLSKPRLRVLAVAEDGLARSVTGLAEDANVSPAVVRGLIAAGALMPTGLPEFSPFKEPDPEFAQPALNADQAHAASLLREAVRRQAYSAHLLDGVTGSGKTEVYFEAVAEALRHGKQVLILLPEIALTIQFLERFAERFGVRPAEWHSDLSQKERRRAYRAVMKGEARVVVGARVHPSSCLSRNWAWWWSMKSMNRPSSNRMAPSITPETWQWFGRGLRNARWCWPAPRLRWKASSMRRWAAMAI